MMANAAQGDASAAQSEAGGNLANASSRLTDTGTLSSRFPASFHVKASSVCGPANLNSADRVGLPPIMSLNAAMRFCSRLKTMIGYDHGECPPEEDML